MMRNKTKHCKKSTKKFIHRNLVYALTGIFPDKFCIEQQQKWRFIERLILEITLPNGPTANNSLIRFAKYRILYFCYVNTKQWAHSLNMKFQYWREYEIRVEFSEKKKPELPLLVLYQLSCSHNSYNFESLSINIISFVWTSDLPPPSTIFTLSIHAFMKNCTTQSQQYSDAHILEINKYICQRQQRNKRIKTELANITSSTQWHRNIYGIFRYILLIFRTTIICRCLYSFRIYSQTREWLRMWLHVCVTISKHISSHVLSRMNFWLPASRSTIA